MTITGSAGTPATRSRINLRFVERELARPEACGILEKYYRTRARTLAVPSRLFRERSPDETIAAVFDFLQDVTQGFMQSLSQAARGHAPLTGATTLSRWHLWMTEEEVAILNRQMAALVEPYEQRRGLEGERELSFVQMLYNPRTVTPAEDEEPVVQIEDEDDTLEDFTAADKGATVNIELGKRLRTWTVGVTSYGRQELERVANRGNALDIVSFGHATFRNDVSPELADRAIYRFRHRGSLSASPAVREVLMRKGGKTERTE